MPHNTRPMPRAGPTKMMMARKKQTKLLLVDQQLVTTKVGARRPLVTQPCSVVSRVPTIHSQLLHSTMRAQLCHRGRVSPSKHKRHQRNTATQRPQVSSPWAALWPTDKTHKSTRDTSSRVANRRVTHSQVTLSLSTLRVSLRSADLRKGSHPEEPRDLLDSRNNSN